MRFPLPGFLRRRPLRGWPFRRSFRNRLVSSLVTIGIANLVIASLFYAVNDVIDQRDASLGRLGDYAERIASRSDPDAGAVKEAGLGMLYPGEVDRVELRSGDGAPLRAWTPDGAPREPGADPPAGARWFGLHVERIVQSTERGGETLVVFGSANRIRARLLLHLRTLGVLGAAALGITLVISHRVHAQYSKQLLGLVRVAEVVSTQKDYGIRAAERGDEEFRVLGAAFNQMLAEIAVQQKQLEEQVESAKAGQATKAQFLATMSHEIRTPINGILGISELLRDTSMDEQQASFVRTINESANSLLRIVNDVLDFSKIEAGHIEVDAAEFLLDDLVDGCLETIAALADPEKLRILRDVRPGVPKAFVGDPARVRQVLLNLLGNALKFTVEGEIVLRVSPEERGWIRFDVKDTGIGIPEDRLGKLFKSFSQVDGAYDRKYEGTGLGLVISKQIVEAMGGSMFVRTKPEVGSIFGFRLRLPAASHVGGVARLGAPSGLRILLVEEQERDRDRIAFELQEHHTVVVEDATRGARAALQRAAAGHEHFDACLVAAEMLPDLLGLPGGLPEAPLVVLRDVFSEADVHESDWPAPTAVLPRPVQAANLSWCLRQMVRPVRMTEPALPSEPQAADAAAPSADELMSEPSGSSGGLGEAASRLAVLVAEDNAVNQLVVKRFLQKLGVSCTLVANGQQAVDATRERAYDLIFMDIQMPVMDGVEAVRLIREEEPAGAHVSIAALTANVMAEERDTYLAAGFDHHLPKPLRFDALRDFLGEWLATPRGAARTSTG